MDKKIVKEVSKDQETGIEKDSLQEEGNDMALLAKPSDSIIKIDQSKSKQFIEERKKNTIKPEFLEQCQRYNKIMNRKVKRG
jgi:hypothetical protein